MLEIQKRTQGVASKLRLKQTPRERIWNFPSGRIIRWILTMKADTPESAKPDAPTTKWGKVFNATPVIMTVIATMLAGLSSSEMTRAQYDRSLAAQLQSKAGDQWNFFQGKKLRGALQHSTLDTLAGTFNVAPLDHAALATALAGTPLATTLDSATGQQALAALTDGILPKAGPAPTLTAGVQESLKALEHSAPDLELAALLAKVPEKELDDALHATRAQALAFDAVIKQVSEAVEQVEKQVTHPGSSVELRHAITAARLNYNALRYDAEARLNQSVASLYELQVRKSNVSAERHHRRSQSFFYGMLAAQMGVIIATLGMAAKKRNLLWSLAAGAGAVAISFSVYIYLYV